MGKKFQLRLTPHKQFLGIHGLNNIEWSVGGKSSDDQIEWAQVKFGTWHNYKINPKSNSATQTYLSISSDLLSAYYIGCIPGIYSF